MKRKEEFINLFNTTIRREGKDRILTYLNMPSCDFFTAPASTRYHGSYEGGLVDHSLNVYYCLKDYLSRDRVKDTYKLNVSEETLAIVSLLHDFCKINVYVPGKRNVKDDKGVWQSVPVYDYNDKFPYGHGEKSVYMISNFIKLTHEEAFAIRFHMGFSSGEDAKLVGDAFKQFPLSFVLSTADMEATYFLEK
jgi:hypothetical protein